MTAPSPLAVALARDPVPGGADIVGFGHHRQRRVLHEPGVRILTPARFSTSLALSTLVYGVMVDPATAGVARAIVSLVGAIGFLTALVFAFGGCALAEIMPTRSALIVTYVLQAAACFIVPAVMGVNPGSLLFLVFIEATLGQLGAPMLKAATAEVTTPAQVAVAAALLSRRG